MSPLFLIQIYDDIRQQRCVRNGELMALWVYDEKYPMDIQFMFRTFVVVLYPGYCRPPVTVQKSEYDSVSSSGKRLENYVPRTRYGPTTSS
jgi:hypothetical protein